MKTQLLCTFAHRNNLDIVVEYIKQNFAIPEQRIFIFANEDGKNDLYCTFNADDTGFRGKNTISIHRKKETNTLYTVNALNEVIMNLNNGILDTTFQVDWNNYRNTMLTTSEEGVKKIPTKIKEVVYIKTKV